MARSKLSDRRARHDHYHQRARREGYAARSVFKLSEIDRRFGLLRPGARVLDLGCRPGSWLQYCRQRGASALVGVDRSPLDIDVPGARIVVGDVHAVEPAALLAELALAGAPADARFDVVLSDMAPDTSGIRHADQARSEALFERALWIARHTLTRGGHFVGKLFQGPEFQRLVADCRASFDAVKMVKPKGSRQQSIEQYVVARGFRGLP
ncbi:MAG: RlmE family RNA methyltransferase [Deltaproteobacteria bacterium]|nr:MAG: RlmE family RNA methyltransferase [Deltaproteobacteria bacterium]